MNFFILFILSFLNQAMALDIEQVEIFCGDSEACIDSKEKFKNLHGKYRDHSEIKNALSHFLKEGGYRNFNYSVENTAGKNKLLLTYELKEVVREVEIFVEGKPDLIFAKKLLPLKEGDYFQENNVKETIEFIKANLKERGFDAEDIKPVIEIDEGDVFVRIIVKINKIRKVKRFNFQTDNPNLNKFIKQRLMMFVNRPPDLLKLKSSLSDLENELFHTGYYYNSIKLVSVVDIDDTFVEINLDFKPGLLHLFSFSGLRILRRNDISMAIKEAVKKNVKDLDPLFISKEIKSLYAGMAYLNPEIDVQVKEYRDNIQKEIRHFYVKVKENKRTKVANLSFLGNTLFSSKELKKIFDQGASDLAYRRYFDADYYEEFTEILKSKYYEKGYVQVEVGKPIINARNLYKVDVEYKISEFEPTIVDSIKFSGVDENVIKRIESKLKNKANLPFNPLIFKDDIDSVQEVLREDGYIYAEIKNLENNALIKYSEDSTSISINYDIELGPKVFLDKIIVVGNSQTKTNVITREIFINRGEIITPNKVDEIKNNLLGLGLFSNVKVLPLKETLKEGFVDLLISVKERNFGTVEVAPGFRTDLGPKISSSISYNNLNGMNRTLTLRGELNKRVNGSTLDTRRRNQGKDNYEYNIRTSFTEPYLFGWPFSYTTSLSTLYRRFYAFDAEIVRFNNSLTKNFTRWFSASLTHQYETIDQKDATNFIDNGYFQVGALIPSITFDFRDNRSNPLKGAFLNLSIENANPLFLSQKSADLEIDYYKLVSRNNFYVPLDRYGVIATNISLGKQSNQSSNGYIPNIKVFRLSGVDIVRGFDNTEISRQSNGVDLSAIKIDQDAYFLNLKFEPRYFINDETMIGVFCDAGRVYVNHFDPSDLRKSAGISFKYLTPVGSLNFDYGFKLDRKTYPDGTKEDPGRFHVSIGFF